MALALIINLKFQSDKGLKIKLSRQQSPNSSPNACNQLANKAVPHLKFSASPASRALRSVGVQISCPPGNARVLPKASSALPGGEESHQP